MRVPGKGRSLPSAKESGKISLLGGLCFFLAGVESLIPKPLPFLRLGLANLPLLFALDIMPFSSFMLLAAVKTAGQALISGALFSYGFLFSAAGSGASALFMYALRRGFGQKRMSLIGISVAGAAASNMAQLVLAYFLVFGPSARYAAAPVLAAGTAAGILLGTGAEYFKKRSVWYARAVQSASCAAGAAPSPDAAAVSPAAKDGSREGGTASGLESSPPLNRLQRFRKARDAFCRETFSSRDLAIAGLCMAPALLLNPDGYTRAIQFLFFWLLAALSGKKNNPLATLSVIAGIVFFNLLAPYGEELCSIGPLALTSGALAAGIRRAATLEGLFMLSRCCVRGDLAFPGTFGTLAGESFRVFSRLAAEKKPLALQNWAGRLDGLLLSLETGTAADEPRSPGPAEAGLRSPGKAPGRAERGALRKALLAGAIALAWLPLAL